MALTVIQINSEIGKNVGYFRAKDFQIAWEKNGCSHLVRLDYKIAYKQGAWRVYPIVEKVVQTKAISKHHSLYLALKSVH
ncbi:hypothetical protein HWB57_gp096 [Erwinia phage vB_EamM-Bue1]|uniref:Uncharacterized protein n=2 Tax=Nezavisimistyvirus TaxID=2841279 RepID=A0A0A0YXH0_9CAUD|nr:hypothetical protein NW77_085 [Erwinia phage phiEa2809]YP_009837695.1 hypothetical protein HWB57_gp096 [Erwinia phage vB_EamM-Bue1]AIX13093.1 hypothetical protein NW77_085 [Erwinia phage phiEa2809]AVO22936.1 hypothetical protein [Erwinia phage vB_EamM-Bue1]